MDKLITCPTCQKQLATTAVNCPHCGAANDWTPPAMQQLLAELESGLDLPDSYRWQREGPLLMIRTYQEGLREPTSQIVILSLLGGVLSMVTAVEWFGWALIVLGLLRVASLFLSKHKGERWLALDYSADQPDWRSNDERYFRKLLQKQGLLES